ncbi:hypothetical protein JW960_04055 [candidate division KSB1 bacterium]|nr:hypothetical protein [candidate division KSB1 bacterium]
MKRTNYFVILVLTVVFSVSCSTLFARGGYGVNTVKVGYFNPKDAKGGLMLGAVLGSAMDEAVDVGIGIDFFRGSNSKETPTGEATIAGVTEKGSRLDAESSSTIVPITAQVNVKIPASYTLFYTIGGGVGYEMLWTKEKEFSETGDVTDANSRFYHGMRWVVNAGILYKLGSRSSLLIEGFYDGSKLSRKDNNITYKVDPSGFGIRGGIRFGIL